MECEEDDEGGVGPLLDRAGEAEPVDPGEDGVQDHQVRRQALDGIEHLVAAPGGSHEAEIPARGDPLDDAGEEGVALVHDEHAQRGD